MTSRLTEIIENKKLEVAARKAAAGEARRTDGKSDRGSKFIAALQKSKGSVNLICELKPRSPSAGVLKADFDLDQILPEYVKEAAAISVLTDEKYFGGNLSLLTEVSEKTSLRLLCKDFIIDPFQCGEAKQAGASAILLIVKILSDQVLQDCHVEALGQGLAPVVEVQNEEELTRAMKLKPRVILINNRNLDTFAIDMQTTAKLAPLIPDNITKIAASGYASREDIMAATPYCHNFLVGSSLMKASNLGEKLAQLKGRAV